MPSSRRRTPSSFSLSTSPVRSTSCSGYAPARRAGANPFAARKFGRRRGPWDADADVVSRRCSPARTGSHRSRSTSSPRNAFSACTERRSDREALSIPRGTRGTVDPAVFFNDVGPHPEAFTSRDSPSRDRSTIPRWPRVTTAASGAASGARGAQRPHFLHHDESSSLTAGIQRVAWEVRAVGTSP